MENVIDDVLKWLDDMEDYQVPSWEELPEMDLYMDQVINFLEKKLEPMTIGDEKMISSYMINNYVKGGVIPPPSNKKYNKEHMAYLLGICLLKQVVSLKDLTFLFDLDKKNHAERKSLYIYFKRYHDSVFSENKEKLKKEIQESRDLINNKLGTPTSEEKQIVYNNAVRLSLTYLAFKHAIEAEVHRTLAERIINQFQESFKEEKINDIVEDEFKGRDSEFNLRRAADQVERDEEKIKKAEFDNLKNQYDRF